MFPQLLSMTDGDALDQACEQILSGGVIAFPTDTVYGIGGLARSARAIHAIYAIKGRSFGKPLPVMVAHVDQLELVASHIPPSALRLAHAFWPGALTMILPKRADLPAKLTPLSTVGVRIPDHAFVTALIDRCGPLAVTSANRSGKAETLTAAEVLDQLGSRLGLIVDGGPSTGGVASTVVDLSTPEVRILRPGPIDERSILAVLSGGRDETP